MASMASSLNVQSVQADRDTYDTNELEIVSKLLAEASKAIADNIDSSGR